MILQVPDLRIVLASGSAPRRRLLTDAGLAFSAVSPGIDEGAVKTRARRAGSSPETTALELARLKAEAVRSQDQGAIVIGCDQLLVCGGKWFDKPANMAVLREQLVELQGREHMLVTATVCLGPDRPPWTYVEVPRLRMRRLSPEFLDAYIALEGGAVLACVGGYRLEGPGIQLFEEVSGDYSTILGLPLLPLLGALREWNILAS